MKTFLKLKTWAAVAALFAAMCALAPTAFAQSDILFKKHFGGSGFDIFQSVTAVTDGMVTVGYSLAASFGNGDWAGVTGLGYQDATIVKFDNGGNVVWKKNFGGIGGVTSNQYNFVTTVSDGVVSVGWCNTFGNGDWTGVTGRGTDDAIIVKYNNSGNVVWKKNFGGSNVDQYYSVTTVSDGIVAVGYSNGSSFGNGDWSGVTGRGGEDAIIVKYDNSGNVVWKKHFGGSGNDTYQAVFKVSDGIVAAGYSADTSFGNGDWTGVAGRGGEDAIIVKYDNSGNVVWKKNFGGIGIDRYRSVIATSDGIAAVGYSVATSFGNGDWAGVTGRGGDDAIIVKYDNTGNVVWKKHFGGNDNEFLYSVTAVSDGLLAAGYSPQNSFGNGDWAGVSGKGDMDAILIKYDNAGNVVWKKHFGGIGNERFYSVTPVSGGIAAVGYSVNASFGNGDWVGVTPIGGDDAIIVKYLIPVTNIADVPATTIAGVPLNLTATVSPAEASYKTIQWSVKNAGTTGASVNGNTLNTTAGGTAVITATISNGTAIGTSYTKDFNITVKSVSVGTQSGTLNAGTAGSATFTVTTANIATGSTITLNTTVTGVTLGTTKATTGSSTTVTINTTTATPQGTHPLTLTIDGVTSASFNLVVGAPKTVTIGAQVGTLNAGTAGSATFTVTTANIANGSTITLNGAPTGVTLGTTTTAGTSTTVTINTTASTPQGTHSMTLTIDGVTSASFNLVVGAPKTVTVGAQVGTLNAGTAGSVTYQVTTANIANGSTITLNGAPTGVTLGTTTTAGISTTVTINTTANTPQGTHSMTLTIDGVTSASFNLVVGSSKTVTVGTQNGTLNAGIAGSVTYSVTTANIAAGSTITLNGAPTGVTLGTTTTAGTSTTVTINTTTDTPQGTHPLTLTIDGVTSASFNLVVGTAKSVTVGVQNGTLNAGSAGNVTYTVTTTNIATGSAITLNNISAIAGISLGSTTTTTTGTSTTILISTTTLTPQGSHPLSLTIDGVTSANFNLVVGSPKTVTVSAQNGTLNAGVAGNVTYTVTTENIVTGSTITLNNISMVAGISLGAATTTTTGASTTILISATAATPQGSHPLTLTIDGVTSASFNLVVGAPIIYTVMVIGGTASPTSGTTGTLVTLTAGTAAQGKQFKEWRVVSGGVTITGNTFTIGTANVEIEAVWEDIPKYAVTVIGGTLAGQAGSGEYYKDATVAIVANEPAGQKFKNWTTTSPGVTFADANSKSTTFVMPANAVTVTANYEKITSNPEILFANLNVYPNPFTDVVRITWVHVGAGLAPALQTGLAPALQTGRGQAVPLRIINAAGIAVHTQTITGNDETIRLGHLPEGVYFFVFEKEGKEKTVKVIKIQ